MEVTTLAELGTALGTLVLALATFAAVRSANRSTLLTERSLLAAIRPLLVSSRLLDDDQKVGFVDDHWVTVKGGRATAEAEHDAVYLTISLRNVGTGKRFVPPGAGTRRAVAVRVSATGEATPARW